MKIKTPNVCKQFLNVYLHTSKLKKNLRIVKSDTIVLTRNKAGAFLHSSQFWSKYNDAPRKKKKRNFLKLALFSSKDKIVTERTNKKNSCEVKLPEKIEIHILDC